MKKIKSEFKSIIWPSYTDSMVIILSLFIFLFLWVYLKNLEIKQITPADLEKIAKYDNLLKHFTEKDLKSITETYKNESIELKKYKELELLPKEFLKEIASKSDGLIEEKNGKFYVGEKFLFEKGEDKVKPEGKVKLKRLAQVLKNTFRETELKINKLNKKKKVLVRISGHTDPDEIKTIKFNDNWDLSSSRAANVLRVLNEGADGFPQKNMMIAGFGAYQPLPGNNNRNDDEKAQNRRITIEIVFEEINN